MTDDSSQVNNFVRGEAEPFLKYLVGNANDRLTMNKKMNLPVDNDTPALAPHYSYRIAKGKDATVYNGFYFVQDPDLGFFINKGKNRNNYSRDVIKAHAINNDTILNIFIMPHQPDSLISKTYKAFAAGIALGPNIKLAGLFQLDKPAWEYATLLNHEIGHVFGLSHAWTTDGCDDTPKNPNCFYQSGVPPCDGVVSNNLMDYNNSQMAITPCQLGKIHKKIADTSSFQRRLVVPTWCQLDESNPIVINKEVSWLGARDVSRNIVIENGGHLTICCRLSMPKGSSITVKSGGKLTLQDITLHNDCGDTWRGIFVEENKDLKGEVEEIGKVKILNVVNE